MVVYILMNERLLQWQAARGYLQHESYPTKQEKIIALNKVGGTFRNEKISAGSLNLLMDLNRVRYL